MAFKKATKAQSKARIALCGPSGSGKTYTSLKLATSMGESVAVIDTERGSASKYADEFEFDVMELDSFHPQKFIDGIHDAEMAGYDVLVIDSLSHAWMGKGGVLELHDQATSKQRTGNSYVAWRDVTPIHNQLIDAMLQSRMHIIVTMRSKTDYVQTEENGRKVVKKVGMAPIQRDGLEYEFDVVGDMDFDNNLIIGKTRCKELRGAVISMPGEETAQTIIDWLTDGVDPLLPIKNKWQALAGSVDGFDDFYRKQRAQGVTDAKIEEFLTKKCLEKANNEVAVTTEDEGAA